MSMLKLEKVTKIYEKGTVNEACIFRDFDFSVEKGEFVSIVGSNGSGKTTLLNIVGGSVGIDIGKVILDGKDVTKLPEYRRAAHIGRVFQNPSAGTAPNMTIAENLSMADGKGGFAGLRFGIDRKRLELYKSELSKLDMGLEDKLRVKAGALSGGQRQALALVMSTLSSPELLLLDEHTAALDPRISERIMELTDSFVREKKLTVVMVTHNLLFALRYGNRLVMMDKGKAVMDKCGEEKKRLEIEDLLSVFNKISLESGN